MEWILFFGTLFFFFTTILFGVMWIFSRRKKDDPTALEALEILKTDRFHQQEEINQMNQKLAQSESSNFELRNQIANEHHRNEVLSSQIQELNKRISVYQSDERNRDAQTDARINELNKATQALHDEKSRIQREDDEKRRAIEENRSRLWNDHEQNVLARLRDICKKTHYSFSFFTNSEPPEEFIKMKPDMLIEFQGQYILIDAKKTKDTNPNTYIKNQVEKTVDKIRDAKLEELVFRIFVLVVPSSNLAELKESVYFYKGFTAFVISQENLETMVAFFKEIEKYAIAQQYDPTDREKIINLIAQFDSHIRHQNAIQFVSTLNGLNILEEKKSLPTEILSEVETKRKLIKNKKLSESQIKQFMTNPQQELENFSQSLQGPNFLP